MSMTEALRVQLDNAERAKQQLEAENARLRDEHPEEAALVDATTAIDRLREERDRLSSGNQQVQALYDQLLQESRQDQQELEGLREELSAKEDLLQEHDARGDSLQREMEELQNQKVEAERVAQLSTCRVGAS